jgi:hypothetical protein
MIATKSQPTPTSLAIHHSGIATARKKVFLHLLPILPFLIEFLNENPIFLEIVLSIFFSYNNSVRKVRNFTILVFPTSKED